jgi:hypothetical protein
MPNSRSDRLDVINPRTFKVEHFPVHVTPSYDLRTLWVGNALGNSLTPIDLRTGRLRAGPSP